MTVIDKLITEKAVTKAYTGTYFTGGDESAELVIYVDKGGDDSNDGRSMFRPVKTIEAALDKAGNIIGTEPSWAANQIDGAQIMVGPAPKSQPHTIANQSGPLEVPRNTTVRGTGVRSCFFAPAAPRTNGFALNSGTRMEMFGITGFTLEPLASTLISGTNPIDTIQTGFAFCWKSGANITLSPAIHDVTNHSYLGGGVHADGSILDNASLSRLITTDAFTNVLSGGFAYVVDGTAYVEIVSGYAYTMRAHVLARNGGAVDMTNSKTGFGAYSLIADGYRTVTYPSGYVLPGKLYANGDITLTVNGADKSYGAGDEIPEGAVVKSGGATLRFGSRIVTNSHTLSWLNASVDGADDNWGAYPPEQGGTGARTQPERIAVGSNHGVVIGQFTDESGSLRSVNRTSTDDFQTAKNNQANNVANEIVQESSGVIVGLNYLRSILRFGLAFFKSR